MELNTALIMSVPSLRRAYLDRAVRPGRHGQTSKPGLVCMQRIAPVTAWIANSVAGVFANWILRGKFKQILLKTNPSKV